MADILILLCASDQFRYVTLVTFSNKQNTFVMHSHCWTEDVVVNSELNEIALSILSGLHQSLTSDASLKSKSTLHITEAARLAGLTFILSSQSKITPYSFSHLSYEAERLQVSNSVVSKLATEALDSFSYPISKTLEIAELVTLLGIVHSLGCYHLPLTHKKGTSQKPLGAYYTPPAIANYIVELTLSPTHEKLAEKASKKGVEALQEILSLRTIDPACGAGVFLISSMNAYDRAMKKGIKNALDGGVSRHELRASGVLEYGQKIRHNMYGVDIDAGALEVTDISLRLLSHTAPDRINESTLGVSLKQGDSLISLKGLKGNSDYRHYFTRKDSLYPFEWHDEFGDVLENGGFDFIVMNPPYERLKPNLAEFLREQLLTGEREIHLENFSENKNRIAEAVKYFRNSGEYQFGNRYAIDTHRLFIERTLQISREGGNIGFIVPSTILGDLSSHSLRSYLIRENTLRTVDDFPETSRLFDSVTQSVSVITLEKGGNTKSFSARFGLTDINEAMTLSQVRIPAARIERVVGSSLSIPQVNKIGWNLLTKLHKQPSISSLNWLSVNRGELDLTLDKDCISSTATDFRLIRGSNISRYTLYNRSVAKTEFVDIRKLMKNLGTSTRAAHIQQNRLACQQISNRTQRWRLKFAPIPPSVVLANSCNYIATNVGSSKFHNLILLGILNSELMNWRFSLTNTNNHVSTRELTQLPIVDYDSSIYKEITSKLIEDVKKLRLGTPSPRIEACVFSLYGFSTNEANALLKLRATPKNETIEIIRELDLINS